MRQPSVLFDLGNVLVHLDFPRGLAHLRRLAGARAPPDLEAAALFLDDASLACNQGEATPDEFLATLAERLGDPELPRARLAEAWCDIFTPWPEMEALADEVLAAGHAAYLASNTDPLHVAFLSVQMPLLRRLTGLFLSYEARLLKPDPAYFRALLARFGLEARACVYLDDRPEHVEAARALGIRGLVHGGDAALARAFLKAQGVALP